MLAVAQSSSWRLRSSPYVVPSGEMPAQVEHESIVGAHVGATDASDGVLARRAADGGGVGAREAEAELCRRFAPRVRLYGLKHLRDEDRARDLVQAVLVTVITALRAGRVEDCDRIDRFVLGTARNVSMKMRTQDMRATPMAPSELPEVAAMIAVRETAVDIEALMRCIARLEQRAQTVLHLSFYRDKQAEEIAAVLETTAGNVRVVRHRAIAQLKNCLAAGEAA
jgi:RNA polymerase sigma-70 factor (ECF subfamily)